ncbi:HAMP domain-containing sensor histidine kinase [Microvirga sp. VF16]|uniref:sensor histidine kinase n=1 Tax=Microvirga sp. VF16 TaxID=2807101 RepID=UPI00193CAAA7|nr:HAMP domain-containing sensor histidine kinase [Microvirga sp. VF16]QRM30847.1 HAMP domain-containing histidine kinase [Microvirga sp. VF16]
MREIAFNVVSSVDDLAQMPAPPLESDDMIVVQSWDADGRLLKSFPPGFDLPRQAATGFANFGAPSGQWRSYTWVLDDGTVQVSQRASVRQELALMAALPAIIIVLFLIPVSALLVRWLVGRILTPVDALTSQLMARKPDSTRQLATSDVPSEIAPLIQAMNKALERLAELLASQQRFVSNAAHQLRTPLTALRIQAGTLRHASNGEATTEILDDMDLALRKMSTLTNQLLTLARAETPVSIEAPQRVGLADALQEAMRGVAPLAESKSIRLDSIALPTGVVHAERQDLVAMFSNLLDNAIRYTPPGGQITVSARRAKEQEQIEIADTGPGISNELLERVCDPFVRGDHEQEGTGLGLSIVKALAARMGGRISLQNKPDRCGLVVRIELPLRPETHAP